MRRTAVPLTTLPLSAAFAAALLLGACGPDPATGSVAVPATQPPAVASTATGATTLTTEGGGTTNAPEALQFTAPLVGGGTLDATTLADKPTVFWFWAPG
ncbi:MAG: hypothetical protein ACKPDI_01335 [Actinomycetota bacterium]